MFCGRPRKLKVKTLGTSYEGFSSPHILGDIVNIAPPKFVVNSLQSSLIGLN